MALFLSALALVGVVLYLKPGSQKPAAPAQVAVAPAAPAAAPETSAPLPMPAPVAPPPRVLTDEERQATNDAEIGRLQDWSMNNDPASLSNILMDLTNSEKEVREAAIEATKQFGSTNAIPVLKAAAMNAADTDEQIAMLEAAKFLELPPLTFSPPTPEQVQAQQQRRAQNEAQRHPQAQQNQNQAAQPAPAPTGPN